MSNPEPRRAEPPAFELRHRLARSLEHANMRASAMQDYIGVSESTMTNYLAGRTRPKPGALRAWALATGVPFEWLIGQPDEGCTLPVGESGYNDSGATPIPLRTAA